MTPPEMWILAGPNGAGKTTLAGTHFRDLARRGDFLNADEYALQLSPDDTDRAALAAGRKLLARRAEAMREGHSFVVETTLASHSMLRAARAASAAGYRTGLIFLWIVDPELCIQRVAARVAAGGHFIPSDVVARRYWRGLANLPDYLNAVDSARIISANAAPQLVARTEKGVLEVLREKDWSRLSAAFPARS